MSATSSTCLPRARAPTRPPSRRVFSTRSLQGGESWTRPLGARAVSDLPPACRPAHLETTAHSRRDGRNHDFTDLLGHVLETERGGVSAVEGIVRGSHRDLISQRPALQAIFHHEAGVIGTAEHDLHRQQALHSPRLHRQMYTRRNMVLAARRNLEHDHPPAARHGGNVPRRLSASRSALRFLRKDTDIPRVHEQPRVAAPSAFAASVSTCSRSRRDALQEISARKVGLQLRLAARRRSTSRHREENHTTCLESAREITAPAAERDASRPRTTSTIACR